MIRNAMIRLMIRFFTRNASADNYHALRRTTETLAAHYIRMPDRCVRETAVAGGVPAEWVSCRDRDAGRIILYLHGGGYVFCSPVTHRGLAYRIARACGARALVLDYRLAPEHPHPAAVEDAIAAYRWLLEGGADPARLAVAGDSAGGGLALVLLQRLRDLRMPLPACASLLSPWTDLTCSGESMRINRGKDPIIRPRVIAGFARLYAPEDEFTRPTVSPLFGDLSALPPLLIQAGSIETLLDDSRRVADKAAKSGTPVELEVWPGMIHVFQALSPLVPEARRAISGIGSFVSRHIPA